jgi:hypothetical protein
VGHFHRLLSHKFSMEEVERNEMSHEEKKKFQDLRFSLRWL